MVRRAQEALERPVRPPRRTPWTVRGPPPGEPPSRRWQQPVSVREQVPELDLVTYAERQYYVPGLAKPPPFPPWERGWHDPHHLPHRAPLHQPLRKDRVCYICHQLIKMTEGAAGGGRAMA